jgi:hypothetical protein
LDDRDGGVTRREALVRCLAVTAVVDQGPDIEGVRRLVRDVSNALYEEEIRIFHRPLDFFHKFGISVDRIDSVHDMIKVDRSAPWAELNRSTAAKYNLFIDSTQTLGYAAFRWGAPLLLARLTEELEGEAGECWRSLTKYLTTEHSPFPVSAEGMSQKLKDHKRFGLGKAIGDKAAHLFAKWVIHSFPLLSTDEDAWGPWSFEVPFDSNAGRVLYRLGILSMFAKESDLISKDVLQPGAGKGGLTYLRVTNMRGVRTAIAETSSDLCEVNVNLCVNHLKTHRRAPRKIELQRIPSILALRQGDLRPGDIDDGLIKVGTTWCSNTSEPNCAECPLRTSCIAAQENSNLITDVRT